MQHYHISPGTAPPRVIEAIDEDIKIPELRSLLDQVGTASILLGHPDPDVIQSVESLGAADGAVLLNVKLRDGRQYWRLVADAYSAEPEMSPILRSLSWVLRNGELADLSWKLRNMRKES